MCIHVLYTPTILGGGGGGGGGGGSLVTFTSFVKIRVHADLAKSFSL